MKTIYKSQKLENLNSILKGNLDLIDQFDMNQTRKLSETVIIKPSNIRKILNRYLEGEISDVELNKWARFICLRTEYRVPGIEDDKIADFYENMYYIIQRVSTPEIDGDLDEESVRGYLAELDAQYPTDPPEALCR